MLHIAIPAILAPLISKIAKSPKNRLSIKGMIEIQHIIKNRIRVYIPILKGDQERINTLLPELNKLNVVTSVSASPITGSLTVTYNQSQIEPVLMLGVIIQLLGLDIGSGNIEKGELEKEFTTLKNSLDTSLMKVTHQKIDTKSAITAFLIAAVAFQLFKNFRSLTVLPAPLTLLWWLYQNNLINKEDK